MPDTSRSNTDLSPGEKLFKRLDVDLLENIDNQYFQEPREFRSLVEVLAIVNQQIDNKHRDQVSDGLMSSNPAYLRLQDQLAIANKVVEEVVTFQHGGLNNSLDTMREIVHEYSRGRSEIQCLRKSLVDTQVVLTSKKNGQVSLKDLYQKRIELQESIRLVRDLDELKSVCHRVNRLIQQKRYLASVSLLNAAINKMFGEDLISVGGLVSIREQIMDMKENLLELCVNELRDSIIGNITDLSEFELLDQESIGETDVGSDNKSESVFSYSKTKQEIIDGTGLSTLNDERSTWSCRLDNVDELVEANLVDPTISTPMYLRLLVKTIGVLRCEDDVERMLLDTIVPAFINNCILNSKEFVANRILSKSSFDSDDSEMNFHMMEFSLYINTLLERLTVSMGRLIFVCKLLFVSKQLTQDIISRKELNSEEEIITAWSQSDNASKKALILAWSACENEILTEIKIHSVDIDVQSISDGPNLQSLLKRRDTMEENEDTRLKLQNRPIFKTSSKLTACIYRQTLGYNFKINKIFRENQLFGIQSLIKLPNNESPDFKLSPSDNKQFTSNILFTTEKIIEQDLIPVIQSYINEEMRNIQLNSDFFISVASNQMQGDLLVIPCYAAEKVYIVSESVMKYWFQLFHHRTMISAVLDRLLRDFVSCAKELLRGISFSWISAEKLILQDIKRYMLKDIAYKIYRQKFIDGCTTIDDYFTKKDVNNNLFKQTPHKDVDSLHELDFRDVEENRENILVQIYQQEALLAWASSFWDLKSTVYPVTSQKALKDINSIRTISSISFGCDWLVMKIIEIYGHEMRKSDFLPSLDDSAADLTAEAQQSSYISRHHSAQSRIYLTSIVQSVLYEIIKISDECIAILRGNCELLCFHYLQKLAHISYSQFGANSIDAEDFSAEDSIFSALLQQLGIVADCILTTHSADALSCVLGPLVLFVPRITLRSLILAAASSPLRGSKSSNTLASNFQKRRFLRMLVSYHQQTANFLAIKLSLSDGETNRRLMETLVEEFDRARKFIAMVDTSISELKIYLRANYRSHSREEIKLLWEKTYDKLDVSFEDFLRDLAINL